MNGGFPTCGLYALIDTVTLARRGLEVVAFADAVLSARPAVVQLRAKDLSPRDTLALLRRLVPLARAACVPLFANDRADLAALAGCDGVHVGQDDLPVPLARTAAPGLLVGISTHDEAQLAAALRHAPDYVAFGPIYETASKDRPSPVVGLARLRAAVSVSEAPVVAIGGIDLARAPAIGACGALGAVIGALTWDGATLPDVRARVAALSRALGGARA